MGWYEYNIEDGIREQVRLLRNNGINTIESCHHAMTVCCDKNNPCGSSNDIVEDIKRILYKNKYRNFKVELRWYGIMIYFEKADIQNLSD